MNLRILLGAVLCVISMASLQAQNLEHFELKAHYTLANTTEEALGVWDTIELTNAPLSDEGVLSHGGYIDNNVNEDSSFIQTPNLDVLNAVQFAVQLEIRIDTLQNRGRPVFIIGNGWRYLGFSTGSDGTFQLKFNNGSFLPTDRTRVKEGEWHTLTIVHSSGDSLSSYYVDGIVIERHYGALDHPPTDVRISNTDFSLGRAYKGLWRNLKVFTSDSTTSPTNDVSTLSELVAFPNPSKGSITIQSEDMYASGNNLLIYDASGRMVREVQNISRIHDVNNLPQGILTLVLMNKARPIATSRIVVQLN